jgi:serine/threonine protein kinase
MSDSGWVGKTIGGRYRIEELIGQGGMSAVYKAEDPNLRRTVAVKMIHAHLSSEPQFVSRFEEEAAAVAQLRHPNIIQVFDFDEHDGTYYMVLDFVPGETLEQRLKRLNEADRRMEIDEVIDITTGICDALDYAHSRGLVHRDIKPSNIMLDVHGDAILMDFGIAKIAGGKRHTATGAVVGTAIYMSPEQIRGEQIDRRVDIYALGVTLFEALSGRPPFEADSAMTTLMMHINDPVPDLSELNPDVPRQVIDVVGKSLEKDRSHRFQTAGEFASALRAVDARAGATEPMDGPDSTEPMPPPEAGATIVEPPTSPAAAGGETAIEEPAADKTAVEAPTPPPPPTAGTAVEEPQPRQEGGPAVRPPSRPEPASPPPPPPTGESFMDRLPVPPAVVYGGGGTILLLILIFAASQLFVGGDAPAAPEPTDTQAPTEAPAIIPTETEVPPTLPPTDTPTPTITPTATVPPGPYVRINGISIEGDHYMVEYETFEYTETLPGMHVHFFYDTVSEADAGVPGAGPWILYGGPRPFREYTLASRPGAATQMCALVAYQDHSIIPGSGNCFDLPES